ncbi:hypothetical protein N9383_05315 [Granulosicoccus sp.]|nr:hypothetical protein [Granulosicoccus sp.]
MQIVYRKGLCRRSLQALYDFTTISNSKIERWIIWDIISVVWLFFPASVFDCATTLLQLTEARAGKMNSIGIH